MFEHRPNLTALRGCLVVVCLTLLAGCLPRTNNPAAPVPADVAATAGDAVITLSWTASMGATAYNVKRATSRGGPYTKLAAPTALTYKDSSVTNGTAYYYVVSSLNAAGGESANSAEVSATPKAPTAPPPVPTGLAAAVGDKAITLTWNASTGASTYNLKRSTTSGGPYTQIASATSTTYVDTPLTNGTTYYYVVSSVNSFGESANSAQVSASPSPPPPTTFGTWVNVTPSNADLTTLFACGNFGAASVSSDPLHPSDVYTQFNCQGIWKSTDYGVTWNGPINTGSNGDAVGDCGGGVTISPNNTAPAAIIYETCIRGAGLGFWKSLDGGVNWTQYPITPTSRQDYFGPSIDPYDPNHLLLIGHEFDSIVESVDGGQTWVSVPLAAGMLTTNQSGSVSFINTGNATGTRGTWLFVARSGGFGTWRTTNAGTTWVQVDKNESGGAYQFDTSGVVFMPGVDSALGNGVLRSTDYGQTWAHVGLGGAESSVWATSKNVYAMFGAAIGPTGSINPNFQVASQPGTGTWVAPGTPPGLADGAASITVVNDGTQNIFVGAMFNSGVWRYIEP
jgi:hypothetical protein